MLRHLSYRFKHSHNGHIIYNILTKSLLIDNSLKKDLELAQKRKLLNAKIKYNNTNDVNNFNKIIEMSESHDIQPYIRNKK
jgi:hypothetical protein